MSAPEVRAGAMAVTVLGCCGSYAAAGGACSGYLLRSATTTIWVDCGPGTFANLQEHVALADVDAIIVSHEHPDHCGELPIVFNAARYYLGIERIEVHTTEGVRALTDRQVENGDASVLFDWRIHSDGDEFCIGDIDVRLSRTDHPVETFAMRLATGTSAVVYTSDTGPMWNAVDLRFDDGRDIGLLLGEATMLDEQEQMMVPHLSGNQLGAIAGALGAGRLLLTHVPPTGDPEVRQTEAERRFGKPVELAATGATYIVTGSGTSD